MTPRPALAAALLLVLAAAGSASAATHFVSITGSAFVPPTVTVNVGDLVVWTNNDGIPHTVTEDNGAFDSGTLSPGGAFQHFFLGSASAPYHCNFHPGMTGTVTVIAPTEIAHGTDRLENLSGSGPWGHAYSIEQHAYTSFEVQVDILSGDFVGELGMERLDGQGVRVQESQPLSVTLEQSRVLRWEVGPTFNPGEVITVRAGVCGGACDTNDRYRIRVYDTTYAIPRFNNSGSQITVLLLQNRHHARVTGTVHFWLGNGAYFASHPFSLNGHAALTLNTSTVPGVAGLAGTMTVTSTAPAGQLAGKAVALEPSTGFTFDTMMVPRLP